ncbi:MAG: primosomal protein N' [Thiotrichales bacterium SG8_50]|nr:MAG: primosomal protein N' [Thiotrichales bacterium SG8_50]
MTANLSVLQVAVPSPLARHFDYLLLKGVSAPAPGTRVQVPFGKRDVVGVVLGQATSSEVPHEKLKFILRTLDVEPLLPTVLMELLVWASAYYHHPIGEVMATALPVLLRRGLPAIVAGEKRYVLTEAARQLPADAFKRSPIQQRLVQALHAHAEGMSTERLSGVARNWRDAIKRLTARGFIQITEQPCLPPRLAGQHIAPQLTPAQEEAGAAILAAAGKFQCLLLLGVTGSGKTEVYLRAIEEVIARGSQVLVLVPEIGLTPQLVMRFEGRLNAPVAVMHSGLNESERLCAWQMARTGQAAVVIGTRSAVYTPMPKLALIIIDEEHDASFKQQDGFRYHARDVAIKRARLENIPILLGSATPALESLHNAQQGRYQLLSLPERTGAAQPPQVKLLDLKRLKLNEGISPPLIEAMQARLQRNEQSLLFLNRRGFAPVLMCHDCGWLAPCRRCDARLTIHQRSRKLRCHHCGAEVQLPVSCPACASAKLHGIGEGTERIETALMRLFPKARIERIDRDSTRRKGSLDEKLRRVQAGEADILVGTQMLTKGHDFPNLTLVGVLNADQGLYSADFRSEERLVQQLVQVAGRAGRADKPGEVLIQTYHPDNPAFAALAHHDYREFGSYALSERQAAQYPPFAYLALLRAESPKPEAALVFLRAAHGYAERLVEAELVHLMDPVPSPMERRAGRYRAQLLVQAGERKVLHDFLNAWLMQLEGEKSGRTVRWSLDVDPIEMY